MSELISGTQGGTHVAGAALTTTYAREASPSLLVNEVDRRVTRIRPMSTSRSEPLPYVISGQAEST